MPHESGPIWNFVALFTILGKNLWWNVQITTAKIWIFLCWIIKETSFLSEPAHHIAIFEITTKNTNSHIPSMESNTSVRFRKSNTFCLKEPLAIHPHNLQTNLEKERKKRKFSLNLNIKTTNKIKFIFGKQQEFV